MSSRVSTRGRTTTILLSLAMLLAPAAVADETPDTGRLLEKALEAMGGRERLSKYPAATWKFVSKGYGPEGVATTTGEAFRQGAEQYRQEGVWEFDGQRRSLCTVIDRNMGWVRNPMGTFPIGEEEDFAETKRNYLYLNWIATLVPLEDKAFRLAPGGELRVSDRPTTCLLVSRDGQPDVLLCFDNETGLLAKSEMPVKVQRGAEEEIGKVLVQETIYGEYKAASGVRYASKITTRIDRKLRHDVEITEFTPLESLPDSTFSKP